ncbi:hypothetical protein GCM10007190_18110 [Macrococcus hajekii]|nr:hypothetical protein [Macrococcus hajekii]GGB10416.1 hypothetical protein GCM10007190_18110 [Macrococcus hajekii]
MAEQDAKTSSKRMKDDTPGLVDGKVREQLENKPGDKKEEKQQ